MHGQDAGITRRELLARAAVSAAAGSAVLSTIRRASGEPESMTPTVFGNAAIAADHKLASQAGLEILRAGGNAVDAAVATSFALSVVRPYSCGIGGGGFMVVNLKSHPRHPKGVVTAINYREWGAASTREEMFEGDPDPDAPTHGGKAVCVPGHVAGMLHALERYGTLPRERVLAPAIALAKAGYAADAHYVESSKEVIEWLEKDASRPARFTYLWERLLYRGKVKVGDRIDLHEQARVLELIAEKGAAGFYEGPVAEAIVRAVNNDGGQMTVQDLAEYRVEEREPLRARVNGREVLTMPPPSSGGIVLAQVMGMLEARQEEFSQLARGAGHNSPEYIHFVAEAMKHAFADRARWMGDPNFVDIPLKGLLNAAYIRDRAAAIVPGRTLPIDSYGTATPPPDDDGTSHLCVVDAHGNAVACTETINLVFGSLLPVPEFGFILNDEMDDFLARKGKANAFGLDHAVLNRPAPHKRPLSSMTPTLVYDASGGLRLIVGGSGGPRIISGTIQAAINVLEFDLSADEAVSRPRFHHQWHPDVLQLEDGLHATKIEETLRGYGHSTGRRQPVAAVQMIRSAQGGWQAASDPRKGGAPAGY
jgi:gamma-glutamyltranspeptidase/glutathione hydrolase